MKSTGISRGVFLLLIFTLVLGGVMPASAAFLSAALFYPSVSGTVTKNLNLGTYAVDTTGPNVQAAVYPSEELRGIWELPINAIPVGSVVQSATLSIYLGLIINSTGMDNPPNTFQLCGYVGDGAVTASDWNNDGLSLQNFAPAIGSTTTFDVTAFVQGLVSNGDLYSGFLVKGFTPYLLMGFGPQPVLDVTFTTVPEPNVMTLVLIAGSMIAFRRRRLKTHLS
jgi:hypothetical protein